MPNRTIVHLSKEDRAYLTQVASSRVRRAGEVLRARLILALADGQTYEGIAQKLQTSAPTIARWKQRFEQEGMEGLVPRYRGSRVRIATAAIQARVLKRLQQMPPDGSTHWSCRKVARALGLSKSTVQRI